MYPAVVTAAMTAAQAVRVDAAARIRGVTRSQFIRQAASARANEVLAEALPEPDDSPPERPA